jgi:putative salt-induced outer membrane protein
MSKLAVKIAYVIRYNNAPPVRNNVPLRTTDTFFSSGVTYSF